MKHLHHSSIKKLSSKKISGASADSMKKYRYKIMITTSKANSPLKSLEISCEDWVSEYSEHNLGSMCDLINGHTTSIKDSLVDCIR